MGMDLKVQHSVKVGNRTYKLRSNDAFFPVLNEEQIKATGPQMRNLAFGSYNLLVEKVLAGNTRGFPKKIRVTDLPFYDPKFRGLAKRAPFKFDELSEDYVRRKVLHELDARPLIATGFYLENIQVTQEESATGTLYSVYVPDIEHEPSGVPLQTLVGWLEYGTTKMPARPHWRPVALVVRRKWNRLPKGIEAEALRQALKKLK